MTQTGQDKQFEAWMRAHSDIALKIARSFERSIDAQADLLQEILLQWWRSIAIYPAHAPPKPWLYRVSLNVALTWQKRESRRSRALDRTTLFSELIEKTPQPSKESSASRDLVAELYSAIQELKPAERALIVLHLDGLSYAEIAISLGLSVNAVGSRLTRIRNHLEKLLNPRGDYGHI
jgi:RNA polymerase sigma-70 factor (ECF subfamily)